MKANPCKAAATRAYRELRRRGVPDRPAFEAAAMVFRCHHPEIASGEAKWIICDWITEELGDTGAEPCP